MPPTSTNPSPTPPDGGWGWVVAIGAAVVQMQVATIPGTFGVYFAHITATKNLPAYLVSAVPSVMGFMMFFFCPISTALAKYYGTRPVALSGAVLVTVSVAISSIIDHFYWFFTFFSIFGGVGSGLILVQGNVTVQKYFVTKRGTANGIFMSGGALGNMLMPILLRISISYVGFRLTLLLHAACISLTIISALTFRPIRDTEKEVQLEVIAYIDGEAEKLQGSEVEKLQGSEAKKLQVTEAEKLQGTEAEKLQGTEAEKLQGTEAEKLQGTETENLQGNSKEMSTAPELNEPKLVCGFIWLPNIKQIFIWKVLKNPLFLVLTFSVITGRTSLRGMGTLLPAFGESIGLDKQTSVYLVSIMSVADLCGRIISPLVTDYFFPKVAKKYFFIACTSMMAIALFILGCFVQYLPGAVLCCVLFGVGMGGVAAFMNVIFAESLGIEIIQDTIGLMYLFTGLWMLPTLPIIGLLRDLSGNFKHSFLGLSATTAAGTLIWLAEPSLRRFGKTTSA